MIFKVIIPGRAYVKKNTQRTFGRGKSTRVVYSDKYQAWEKIAHITINQHLANLKTFSTIKGPVNLRAIFAFRDHQAEPDLSALYEGIQDVLQQARIIENDKLIHGHDGSRKIFDGNPRVEVELTLMEAV